jgi:hypothetical protein
MKYPEHEKLQKVQAKSQAIGEFLDNLPLDLQLAVWVEGEDGEDVLMGAGIPVTKVLAAYFGVDEAKLEAEKRAMLADIRAKLP